MVNLFCKSWSVHFSHKVRCHLSSVHVDLTSLIESIFDCAQTIQWNPLDVMLPFITIAILFGTFIESYTKGRSTPFMANFSPSLSFI